MVHVDPKNTVTTIQPTREARAVEAFESIHKSEEVNVMEDVNNNVNGAAETAQEENTSNMDHLVSEFMVAWTTGQTTATGASARAAVLLNKHKEDLFFTIESNTVSILQLMQNKNEQPGSFNEVFHSTLVGRVIDLLTSEGFSDIESEIAIQVMVVAYNKHRHMLDELVQSTQAKMKRRLVLSLEYLAA